MLWVKFKSPFFSASDFIVFGHIRIFAPKESGRQSDFVPALSLAL